MDALYTWTMAPEAAAEAAEAVATTAADEAAAAAETTQGGDKKKPKALARAGSTALVGGRESTRTALAGSGGSRGRKNAFVNDNQRIAATALGTITVLEDFVAGDIEGRAYEFLADVCGCGARVHGAQHARLLTPGLLTPGHRICTRSQATPWRTCSSDEYGSYFRYRFEGDLSICRISFTEIFVFRIIFVDSIVV